MNNYNGLGEKVISRKEINGCELTTGCLFAMGRSSFIDIVARMKRSVIRNFDGTSSRITQASYGLQNIFSLPCALLIAM